MPAESSVQVPSVRDQYKKKLKQLKEGRSKCPVDEFCTGLGIPANRMSRRIAYASLKQVNMSPFDVTDDTLPFDLSKAIRECKSGVSMDIFFRSVKSSEYAMFRAILKEDGIDAATNYLTLLLITKSSPGVEYAKLYDIIHKTVRVHETYM